MTQELPSVTTCDISPKTFALLSPNTHSHLQPPILPFKHPHPPPETTPHTSPPSYTSPSRPHNTPPSNNSQTPPPSPPPPPHASHLNTYIISTCLFFLPTNNNAPCIPSHLPTHCLIIATQGLHSTRFTPEAVVERGDVDVVVFGAGVGGGS